MERCFNMGRPSSPAPRTRIERAVVVVVVKDIVVYYVWFRNGTLVL
jgi:hypothetical protein